MSELANSKHILLASVWNGLCALVGSHSGENDSEYIRNDSQKPAASICVCVILRLVF